MANEPVLEEDIPREEVVVTARNQYRYYDPDKMLSHNLLKSSKFAVRFTALPEAAGGLNLPSEEFTYLCDSIEFPGQSLETIEHRIPGRLKVKYPYQRNFNEVSMTFYHNDKFPIYDIFVNWIRNTSPTNTENLFFDEMVCKKIYLYQFEDTNGARGLFSQFIQDQREDAQAPKPATKYMTVQLLNAYPLNFASMPSNWADDGFQKMTVSFFFENAIVDLEEKTLTRNRFKELLNSGSIVDAPGINSPARPPTKLDFFNNGGTRNA